jgi:hypothetical protein
MRFRTLSRNCLGLAGTLLVLAGCGNQPADAAGVTMSALEIPIFDCQTKHASCLGSAADLPAAGACNEALGQCLIDAAPKLIDLANAVLDCQGKARECVSSGGRSAVPACRQDFLACVGLPSDDDAGVGHDPAGPGRPGSAAPPQVTPPTFPPGLPPQPGAPGTGPGGQGPQGPAAGQPAFGCVDDLRGCVTGGKTPADCATHARECLHAQSFGVPAGR